MAGKAKISAADPIHGALRMAFCKSERRHLWIPADAIDFHPAVCSTIFGDGRALFGLTTINSRPAYYVIRGDSGWTCGLDYPGGGDGPDFAEFTDDIFGSLEEQFGYGRYLDDDEDDQAIIEAGKYPWPAVDDENGYSWWRMEWPPIDGVRFVRHPLCRSATLLASYDPLGRAVLKGETK